MVEEAIRCLHCHSEAVVKYGKASTGKARCRCQQTKTCGRTFIRGYAYPGRTPEVKRQIVEMTLNGSGGRVSPSTVIGELKNGLGPLRRQSEGRRRVLSGRDHGRGPASRGSRGR